MGIKQKPLSKQATITRFSLSISWHKVITLFFLFMCFSKSAWATSFTSSKMGCWGPTRNHMRLDCANQRLRFDVLRKLFTSGKKTHLSELRDKVKLRASYFLKRKVFDYESVLSLLVFPVPGEQDLLKEFVKIEKGKPFAKVALQRQAETRSLICHPRQKRLPYALREICKVRVYR